MSDKEYMDFIEMPRVFPSEQKTKQWCVNNKKSGDRLGFIQWYAGWRQYCFLPYVDAVFSAGCLRDIVDFCEKNTREHKTAPMGTAR